jgi:hypothetical protein
MDRFSSFIIFVLIQVPFTTPIPVSSGPLKERDGCILFDVDLSCSSGMDSSLYLAEADTGGVPLFSEEVSILDLVSFDSGQPSSIYDLSILPSDYDLAAAEEHNLDFAEDQIAELEWVTEPNFLLDDSTDDLTIDQGLGPILEYGSDVSWTESLYAKTDPLFTYECAQYGDSCEVYQDGKPTGVYHFIKCNNQGKECKVCRDGQSSLSCFMTSPFDKQALPSPSNPYGQRWNNCVDKQCDTCNHLFPYLGFFSMGIVPFCGPERNGLDLS